MANGVIWEYFDHHNRQVEEDWRERMQTRPEWDQRTNEQIEADVRSQFRDNGEWLMPSRLMLDLDTFVSSVDDLQDFGFDILGVERGFFITRPPQGWTVRPEGWCPSGVSFTVEFLDESGNVRLSQITNRYLNSTTIHKKT